MVPESLSFPILSVCSVMGTGLLVDPIADMGHPQRSVDNEIQYSMLRACFKLHRGHPLPSVANSIDTVEDGT